MKTSARNFQAEFEDALLRCRKVAEVEYQIADEALGRAETTAHVLRERIDAVVRRLPADKADDQQGMSEVIRHLGERLGREVEHLIVGTRGRLAAKRPRLQKFTIALFGRTMAGKSTFREAITGGDGTSIGKGGQNFTQRVQEYEWRGLHIIDTPGIGSYKGERFRQQAISAVEKSDLVLFLLSDDGIQKDVFDGMKEVLLENKPVFFVLNVKRDLTKSIYRERFLRDPASLLGRERIDGHYRRIQKLAVETLGSTEARVFAVHAQAAYLSTQAHPEAEALHRASRLGELHDAICGNVTAEGPIRRLQTLLDGTIGAIEGLAAFYTAQAGKLTDESAFFGRKRKEFDSRAAQFGKDQRELVTAKVAELFRRLHDQVFDFIEENIERNDIADRWQKRVDAADIKEHLHTIQKQIVESAAGFVSEFSRELAVDTEFAGNFGAAGTPGPADVWDLRRGFNRMATAAGVLSAVALIAAEFGAANIWNPVGWALAAVSIVAGFLAWLTGKKADRLAKEKDKARQQLHDQIHTREQELRAALLGWFKDEVEAKPLARIANDLGLAERSMKSLRVALRSANRSARQQVDRLNRRLLLRVAELNDLSTECFSIGRVARSRGNLFRAIGCPNAEAVALSRVASSGLRENVRVLADCQPEEIIRASLRPVRPKRIEKRGHGFVAHLTRRQTKTLGRITDALFDATRHIAGVPVKFRIDP